MWEVKEEKFPLPPAPLGKAVAGSPKMSYFFYSGNPKKNLSLGASVISNKVFIDTRTQYAIDASYKLEMGGGANLFLGLKAGATNKNTDIDGLTRITQEANPAISSEGNAIFPVFGFGALLKSEKFYVSALYSKLFKSRKVC